MMTILETQKLLICYQQAINKIDDYFEYRYLYDISKPERIKAKVMEIIENEITSKYK